MLRLIITRFLHAATVHMPVLPGSYLDCFISACALARSPWNPSVAYGSYDCVSWSLVMTDGMTWVAICPKLGPPTACSIAALSMIRLTALRTWMSSNGGVARFMVMYQVRSPESKWIRFFLSGWVRYCCRIGFGGVLVNEASRLPDWTLLKMSLTLVSMAIEMPSTLLVRRLSVVWS